MSLETDAVEGTDRDAVLFIVILVDFHHILELQLVGKIILRWKINEVGMGGSLLNICLKPINQIGLPFVTFFFSGSQDSAIQKLCPVCPGSPSKTLWHYKWPHISSRTETDISCSLTTNTTRLIRYTNGALPLILFLFLFLFRLFVGWTNTFVRRQDMQAAASTTTTLCNLAAPTEGATWQDDYPHSQDSDSDSDSDPDSNTLMRPW